MSNSYNPFVVLGIIGLIGSIITWIIISWHTKKLNKKEVGK